MKNLRQLIQKGDPRLQVKIPKEMKGLIEDAAKKGRRRPQDEVIKRLVATFRYEQNYYNLKNELQNYLSE